MIEFEDELPTNPVQVRKGKNADGVTVEMKLANDPETAWHPVMCFRRDKTYQPLNMAAVGAALGYDNLVDGVMQKIG